MSTSAQQAGGLSPFPGVCALHALLLSVYERMVGRASREHLSGGDPLLHTIFALPVLLSIYKRVVGRAYREHLSGGDPLWYTTCALHALPSITKVHEYLPSASDDQTSRLETPCWAGASMRPLDRVPALGWVCRRGIPVQQGRWFGD